MFNDRDGFEFVERTVPYFPPEKHHKFANIHKIFGANDVAKVLSDWNGPGEFSGI